MTVKAGVLMTPRQAWGVALLRVVLGVMFIMHGYYGAVALGPRQTAVLIARIGNPVEVSGALAWYLIVAHLAGGLLLVVGLWTAAATLAQVPIMAAAVFLLHWSQGFFMRGIIVDPAAGRAVAGGDEFPLLALVATLSVALIGPGTLSVDAALLERPRRRPLP